MPNLSTTPIGVWRLAGAVPRCACVANPGITKSGLTKLASESRRRGKPIEAPSGSNVQDLEVYIVKPDHHLTIRGTKKIKAPCADVFPLVEGFFGPLRIPLPRTPCILAAEYGSLWRQTWTVKIAQTRNPYSSRHLPMPGDALAHRCICIAAKSHRKEGRGRGAPWCGNGGSPS